MAVTKSQACILPEELLLEVLIAYFQLPNGLHSERFPSIKKARIDKIIAAYPGFSHLIPEALYKHNQLIIKPSNYDGACFKIPYPTIYLNQYVKDLEFQFHMADEKDWSRFDRRFLGPGVYYKQAFWLKRLAAGELGFGRLETLRLTFRAKESLLYFSENLAKLVRVIEANGPYRIRAKNLELTIHGCTSREDCNEDCKGYYEDEKRMCAVIKGLFQLHQDPLV